MMNIKELMRKAFHRGMTVAHGQSIFDDFDSWYASLKLPGDGTMTRPLRPKWDYFNEIVHGNLYKVAEKLRIEHPDWDVVAVHYVLNSNVCSVLYRVPWDDSRYEQEQAVKPKLDRREG